MRGDVVSWHDDRGYGFIKRDDGALDIFVHQRAIQMRGHRQLTVGARVEFEEEWSEWGDRVEAVHVRELRGDGDGGGATAHTRFVDGEVPTRPRSSATSLMPRAVACKRALKRPTPAPARTATSAPAPVAAATEPPPPAAPPAPPVATPLAAAPALALQNKRKRKSRRDSAPG